MIGKNVTRAALAVALMFGAAQAPAGEGELGIQLGLTLPDKDVSGTPRTPRDLQLSAGLRGAVGFADHWAWFVDGLFTRFDTTASDLEATTLRTGIERRFGAGKDRQWFLGAGVGQLRIDTPAGGDVERLLASLSIGRRHRVRDGTILRWELRVDSTHEDDGFGGANIGLAHLLGSINWGTGDPRDSDGDGVRDGRDRCPGTPRGAEVDERGCPKDGDGDGVWDGLDRCPDTPAGWPVDGRGCPRDSDGDGVEDGRDACPDTPAGAVVDARGCPKDGDGDGVWDGQDRCPDTPAGAAVDARGCPKDSDGDGVWDGLDRCPDTPRGAVVDARGCPNDGDGDGVWDGIDRCPDTPPGTDVDERGCAKLFERDERVLVLEGVRFELDSAVLRPESRAILDRVARSLTQWPELPVEVGGHTDSSGSEAYNQKLSEARSKAVKDYLVGRGVPADQLTTRGYGESRPIADNTSKAGRARNRRVELTRMD